MTELICPACPNYLKASAKLRTHYAAFLRNRKKVKENGNFCAFAGNHANRLRRNTYLCIAVQPP